MTALSPRELIETLRGSGWQLRAGVILVPPSRLSTGRALAAQLGIDYADAVEWQLNHLLPDSDFVGISATSLLKTLRTMVAESLRTDTILVENTDILIAKLSEQDRGAVWNSLFEAFKRPPAGLVLFFPDEANHLFTERERRRWRESHRLAEVLEG